MEEGARTGEKKQKDRVLFKEHQRGKHRHEKIFPHESTKKKDVKLQRNLKVRFTTVRFFHVIRFLN